MRTETAFTMAALNGMAVSAQLVWPTDLPTDVSASTPTSLEDVLMSENRYTLVEETTASPEDLSVNHRMVWPTKLSTDLPAATSSSVDILASEHRYSFVEETTASPEDLLVNHRMVWPTKFSADLPAATPSSVDILASEHRYSYAEETTASPERLVVDHGHLWTPSGIWPTWMVDQPSRETFSTRSIHPVPTTVSSNDTSQASGLGFYDGLANPFRPAPHHQGEPWTTLATHVDNTGLLPTAETKSSMTGIAFAERDVEANEPAPTNYYGGLTNPFRPAPHHQGEPWTTLASHVDNTGLLPATEAKPSATEPTPVQFDVEVDESLPTGYYGGLNKPFRGPPYHQDKPWTSTADAATSATGGAFVELNVEEEDFVPTSLNLAPSNPFVLPTYHESGHESGPRSTVTDLVTRPALPTHKENHDCDSTGCKELSCNVCGTNWARPGCWHCSEEASAQKASTSTHHKETSSTAKPTTSPKDSATTESETGPCATTIVTSFVTRPVIDSTVYVSGPASTTVVKPAPPANTTTSTAPVGFAEQKTASIAGMVVAVVAGLLLF